MGSNKKNKTQSARTAFNEYLLQRGKTSEYKLLEAFPERYLAQWIEKKFPEYSIFIQKYKSANAADIKRLITSEYKTKILAGFFSKGTLPWIELISPLGYSEQILLTYAQEFPNDFKKQINECILAIPGFLTRIEFIYPDQLTSLIKMLPKEIITEKDVLSFNAPPDDPDLIVYYLLYYEKNAKLPPEANFSFQELVELLILQFPEESQMYFMMISYTEHLTIQQKISRKGKSKPKRRS
jgi:hypothetical protein